MPNDNRDWTNGRFMHGSPKRTPPPTDSEIIATLAAALEHLEAYVSGGFEDGRSPPNRDDAVAKARAALVQARRGR